MPSLNRWVFLAYVLPRQPSTPRVTIWRKLKRLGAAQLLDGLVGLPLDSRNREQLEWLADEITDAGGEASLWIAEAVSQAQERELVTRLQAAISSEYGELIAATRAARLLSPGSRRRRLGRLRREFHRIEQRDYFPPPERDQALRAIQELADHVEVAS